MAARSANSFNRNVAAFAGGAVAAVIASRLLPPMMAMAVGSGRAASGGDPFAPLVVDHRYFSKLLSQMEESRDDATFRRTQLLFRLKRRLAAHALAEEDVIYPLLHDEADAEQDADQLYSEHAEIKMLLYRLERVPKDDAQWVENVRKLKALIERHARQEEEVDFPRLRVALKSPERQRMARDLQREKALAL